MENQAWSRYCSPQGFYPLALALIPWLALSALVACAAGLFLGLFIAPVDPHQREISRIVFIHVPASWVSMLLYLATTATATIGWAYNVRLAVLAAQALAPTGLLFAFLVLWTGCLWGKPIWGDWWVWDLRTQLELAQAFLFIGFIVLHMVLENQQRANKAGAILLQAGVLGVVVNFTAEQSWTAWHQGKHAVPVDVSYSEWASLLLMSLGLLLYGGVAVLLRLRCVILERERQSDWVARRGRLLQ
ncbi:MAG: cytochrome c biogenesis protein CcsA [Betaproteobacteria bacterium]|nr:cytochrome c biogenesis protein CcsA [Betaproteobacteria bacterium]